MTSTTISQPSLFDEVAAKPQHNQIPYSVSELSGALKKVVEGNFSHVRVRGEISGCNRHAASGHIYLDLKDDKAVLKAICWKGVVSKLPIAPEKGMDVICTGKMTTYAGQSNYQLVIDYMELAGAGALMAMLEQRKIKLAAEGLFDPARKLPLPYMPRVIGVVTSPTGAVIRDILHRLADRFPCHVLLYPVPVQGKGAELKIAAAIEALNNIDGKGAIPRPDLLIVARGGGSIEDLWCFNEEVVVRAVAASTIPLISAVGHETDTTLIDFASSRRAPTPTAAAEMAVPVASELRFMVQQQQGRIAQAMQRLLIHHGRIFEGITRSLARPDRLLEQPMQRLDEWSERLDRALERTVQMRMMRLEQRTASLMRFNPKNRYEMLHTQLTHLESRAQRAMQQRVMQAHQRLELRADSRMMQQSTMRRIAMASQRFDSLDRMLESLSHHNVLKRGFAYVTGEEGQLLTHKAALVQQRHITIHMQDGEVYLER